MSPSKISFKVKILSDGKEYLSEEKILNSPSVMKLNRYNKFIQKKTFNVTAFTLVGITKNNKFPQE